MDCLGAVLKSLQLQVKVAPQKEHDNAPGPSGPALVINPVGASSNDTKQSLMPVKHESVASESGAQDAPLGSAERPIPVVGAPDVPHGTGLELSHNKAPPTSDEEDPAYKKAANALAISPTAEAD